MARPVSKLAPMVKLFLALALLAAAVAALHATRNVWVRHLAGPLRRRMEEKGLRLEVGELFLDGRYDLFVRNTRLEDPAQGVLTIHGARVTGLVAAARARDAAPLELLELAGNLRVSRDGWVAEGELEYRHDGTGTGPGLEGPVRFRDFRLVRQRELTTGTATGRLRLDATGWTLEDLELESTTGKAQGRLEARWNALEPSGRLTLDAIDARGLVSIAAAIAGRRDPWEDPELASWPGNLPEGARLGGKLERDTMGEVQGTLRALTDTSSLFLELRVSGGGELTGSTLNGRLSVVDALTLGLAASGLRLQPLGEVSLEGRLEGNVRQPALAGQLYAPRLELAAQKALGIPALPVTEVTTRFRADRQRFWWEDLKLALLSGNVKLTGALEYGAQPWTLNLRVELSGLEVSEIPDPAGGRPPLAAELGGKLGGEVKLRAKGGRDGGLVGEGTAQLHEADYRFLRRGSATLTSYGLKSPPFTGTTPLKAQLSIADRRLDVTNITGNIRSVACSGGVTLAADGGLSGQMMLDVDRAFLMQSPALAIPLAVMTAPAVQFPVTVGGTLSAPSFQTDISSVLSKFLHSATGTTAVRGVLDTLWNTMSEAPQMGSQSELDFLFGRILEGGPDSEELMEQLIDTGMSADEIRQQLEEYRRRNRKRL